MKTDRLMSTTKGYNYEKEEEDEETQKQQTRIK